MNPERDDAATLAGEADQRDDAATLAGEADQRDDAATLADRSGPAAERGRGARAAWNRQAGRVAQPDEEGRREDDAEAGERAWAHGSPWADANAETDPIPADPIPADPIPVDPGGADPAGTYAELIGRLAGAEARLARRRAQVHEWYARQGERAQAEVARSTQRVAEADAALSGAQTAVDFTGLESLRLWQILATRMRLRDPARLGPPPGAEETGQPVTWHPARLLDEVRELLDQVRPVRRHRPWRLLFAVAGLLVVAGAGIAAFLLAR